MACPYGESTMSHHGVGDKLDVVYGIHAVKAALGARPIEYVLVSEGHHGPRVQEIIDSCRASGTPMRFAPRQALDRIVGTPQHQNVIAVCSARAYDELETLVGSCQRPLLVALDSVEDPGNLGAVLRTAVAAGSDGVIIPERRAAGLSAAVAHAAAGALEHIRVARVKNLVRALVELKQGGAWIFGFEPRAAKSYLELDYKGACVLVLGGEARGLHRLVREACDELACIPLHGPVDSLNVSVAAGIVLYEAARQRRKIPAPASRSRATGGPHPSS